MAALREYGPAAALLAVSLAWAGALTVWPRDGQPVAVFYPPAAGDAAFAAVVEAGAESVHGAGGLPGAVIASSTRPSFIENLYRGGALAVLRAPVTADCMR